MTYEFVHHRRVEFFETDMAGIVHFSNYLRYMEMAEHDFLRSLGFSVNGRIDGVHVGWPRVHASCDYKAPLKFEDHVQIHVVLKTKRPRTLEYIHAIRRGEAPDAPIVAVGRMIAVCVAVDDAGGFRAIEIPAPLASRLESAPSGVAERYLEPMRARAPG